MHSEVSATDPCPEIPPSFVDATRIPERVRELSRQARQNEGHVTAIVRRLQREPHSASLDRVANRLMEFLVDLDNYRGTGRLYLP